MIRKTQEINWKHDLIISNILKLEKEHKELLKELNSNGYIKLVNKQMKPYVDDLVEVGLVEFDNGGTGYPKYYKVECFQEEE